MYLVTFMGYLLCHMRAFTVEVFICTIHKLGVLRFSILGWSDGGTTSLIIAGCYPQLVRRLVIWGASAYMKSYDVDEMRKVEDISKWSSGMRDPMVQLYGADYLQTMWSKWIVAYAGYWTERNGDLCMKEVKQVRCPTLIIHGQKDVMVEQEHADYLHATIPGSQLVYWPEGKHNLHLKYADEFNKLTEEFLDEDK